MNILYPLAKRFIAGYDFDSAKPVLKNLMDEGYEVSIDYVGELSKTHEDALEAKEQYIDIINFYKYVRIDISIKPTQLGLNINPYISYKHIKNIAILAKKYGHTIRLDMEGSNVTESTRNLAISLNNKLGNVGVAIQANLLRTKKDLPILIDQGVSIRLVKGAYKENPKIAFQKRKDIEEAFFTHAANLNMEGTNKPAIATHDEVMLKRIEKSLPYPKYFDYEFLYGIRRDLQKSLKKKGHKVRVYVPFGEDWLPYTLRRLKEWKNFKFVIRNIVKESLN
jgi:proline dehydrogenase